MEVYSIDATGKKIGRVASEAAKALRGKHRSDFRPDRPAEVEVKISNASRLLIEDKKRKNIVYIRYSGYPGGLKREGIDQVVAKKGYAEVLRRAIYGMLPPNRLRAGTLKRLEISE